MEAMNRRGLGSRGQEQERSFLGEEAMVCLLPGSKMEVPFPVQKGSSYVHSVVLVGLHLLLL